MKSFSEDRIRAYFLGRFPAPEAEVFEEECAASAELTEQAQTIERELADDYLRGNLSAADARLFEENYLVTEARRRRLRTARNVWQAAGGEQPREKVSAAGRNSFWRKPFGGRMVFRLAAGGLLLLIVCAALVFYLAGSRPDENEVAEVKFAEPPARIENPVVPTAADDEKQTPKNEAVNPAAPSAPEDATGTSVPPKDASGPKPAATRKNNAPNSISPAVFTLYAGTLRSDGEQFITLLPATKDVRLQLKLPAETGRYKTYRAVIRPVEGEALYSSPELKSLNLTIPAGKLENRTYIIFLEGKNAASEFESIAEYSFRVRR